MKLYENDAIEYCKQRDDHNKKIQEIPIKVINDNKKIYNKIKIAIYAYLLSINDVVNDTVTLCILHLRFFKYSLFLNFISNLIDNFINPE